MSLPKDQAPQAVASTQQGSDAPSTTRTLYIFRHGETDWNLENRMQGGTDIPLNQKGRDQALALRDFFSRHPVEAFLASDLGRAKETALIAAGPSKTPLWIEPRIRETNLGIIEGLTRVELIAKLGPESWASWASFDQPHFRFPGGESKLEHLTRFNAGIEHALITHPYRTWGVATHGGAMRRFIHFVRPDLQEPVMVPNCAVFKFTVEIHEGRESGTHRFVWSTDLKIQN